MTEQRQGDEHRQAQHSLAAPLALPCGVVLKHRLAKAAMSDSLGNGAGDPSEAQARLYERWAEGGAALSIIGEVQGDPRFPEKPGNLVFNGDSHRGALHALVRRGSVGGAQLWPQLGHAGALSDPEISQPKGPSPLSLDGLRCAGMTLADIEHLPALYAGAARIARDAGFGGVHIHAGHGFLLSQFLSPLFNHRDDAYGGAIEARCRIVLEVIAAVRRAVGPALAIGIKINATDQLDGGLTGEDAVAVVRLLDRASVDLIDISGGTYFPGAPASSEGVSRNGPYFLDFARRAKAVTQVPLMLTGGFTTRQQAAAAVAGGAVDVVGLARAMALDVELANTWLGEAGGDPAFPRFDNPPRGGITAWYTMRLAALAEDREATFAPDPAAALQLYEDRDAQRRIQWRKKFAAAG